MKQYFTGFSPHLLYVLVCIYFLVAQANQTMQQINLSQLKMIEEKLLLLLNQYVFLIKLKVRLFFLALATGIQGLLKL